MADLHAVGARRPIRVPSKARAAGRERRHGRILAAATELFATRGFAKSSVDEIAAMAGVSKGLLYDHYASKEDLLEAVWNRLVDDWMRATLETAFDPDSLAASIGDVLVASIRYVGAHPLLRRIIAQDPGSLFPRGKEDAAAFARLYRSRLEPVLAYGVKKRKLRRDLDVGATAETIWLIHFMLVRELFVGPDRKWRDDAEALLQSATSLIVCGIDAAGGGRSR